MRAVVVGSINLDVVAELSHFPVPGETMLADRVRRNLGGKGANQAVALRCSGADVEMVGRVGEDPNGERLLDGLRGRGVGTSQVCRVPGVESGTAYINVAGGENTIVIASGANSDWGSLTSQDTTVLAAADVVLCQLEVPDEVNAWAAEHTRGRFVLNAAPARAVHDGLLSRCDPLVVNEGELAAVTGRAVASPDDAAAAHLTLLARGVRSIVTTLGDQGSVWSTPEQSGHQPAMSVTAVDTTGAGDLFVGRLASALTAEPDLARAVALATAASGLSVQKPGTTDSYPDPEQTDRAARDLPAARTWPTEETP